MFTIEKLSEKNLYEVAQIAYPGAIIKSQKRISVCNKIMIIDYEVIYNNSVIFLEFDGPTHYTSSKTQLRDITLAGYCDVENIELIRLPYFLQITKDNSKGVFGKAIDITSRYLSGFVDDKITYPGDFNPYGWGLFLSQYHSYNPEDRCNIKQSIVDRDLEITLGLDCFSSSSKRDFINK